jgi:hypothetical protein
MREMAGTAAKVAVETSGSGARYNLIAKKGLPF